ncbi:MAG: TonB-dependent receptor [Candidatus Acidiferrales bacterium]
MNWKRFGVVAFALVALVLFSYQAAWSQATVGTGSIQGVVTDAQGGSVPNATVVITNTATAQSSTMNTTSSGSFSSGALSAGSYTVRVEAPNFKTTQTTVVVEVGQITAANARLELGAASTVVEVTGQAVAVNTDQAQVSSTLTAQQIENLPVNGRNFLDLAQLAPGVQIQDGTNFDPTKAGFSSISFGGRFGRTARIEVDGVDVSDETVGTTTTSIPASAIQEFQLAQSSLDLSNELTSSGAVNVVTKSGGNTVHGEGFGLFRDSSMAAALPGPTAAPFQRSQYGGDVGGPIIKDKLFFFLDGERTIQHLAAPVLVSAPFDSFSGTFASPFHEADLVGKVDYQLTKSLHVFYRFSYFQNFINTSFGSASFSPYDNTDRTRDHVIGADWTTGSFTHSVRFEYLKFRNNISDTVRGSGLPFADLPVSLDMTASNLQTGPSFLAPQATPQSDHQIKYDGSKIWGSHIVRYGISWNHIQGGGFAKFFSIQPLVENLQDAGPVAGAAFVCPNGATGASCPLNYSPEIVIFGNGLGFSTEKKAFGFPLGGLGPDNRLGVYLGDSWKVKPNLTLTYGVRYSRDTGRTDSDLPGIPALNAVLPGFGDPIQQANTNLGPQVGIAWDPRSNGKTVIRAGIGEYFENVIYNNVLFDRPVRLQTGGFLATPTPCLFGASQVPFPDGSVQFLGGSQANANILCSSAIGAPDPFLPGSTVAQGIAAFQSQYQAAQAAAGLNNPNPNDIENLIRTGSPIPLGLFAPAYKTPRSIQMNVGVQHELHPGTILSVDYVRNVSLHYLLGIDVNHTGDAAFLNTGAAQNAISRTLGFCGAGTINAAIANCPTDPANGTNDMGTYVARPATIADFAGNGLDSPVDIDGGAACMAGIGVQCAFGGINPNVGTAPFLEPVGRGVYNAMDVQLTQNVNHPFTGVQYLNFQLSYTYSRFVNSGGASATAPGSPAASDQDFVIASMDNNHPGRFTGPSTLDRPNQLNFGGYARVPFGFQIGIASHFWSALPATPTVPGNGAAAIFETDFTGDGTVQDPLPGYNLGAFGRSIGPQGLANAVSNYNQNVAGKTLTPAGQALVNAGLFTKTQLLNLGATPPQLSPVPSNEVSLGNMRAFDAQVSWIGHIHERLTITPSVSFFNVFNFRNFDGPGNTLNGLLTGSGGSINGTLPEFATVPKGSTLGARANPIGAGSGVFGAGAPRVIEFGLRFDF